MGLDDMMSTETAFVAAVTAAAFSPKTRQTLRRGAVYGVAGVLKAGDVVAGAARGAARGVRGDDSNGAGNGASESKASARRAAATTKSARSAAGS